MKMIAFASRNFKEIIRDKLNICFGIGFPVILLLLLSLIQSNIPIPIFEISTLAPGIAIFGLSFFSLFSGMLIAKDRTTSFIDRLFTSPMTESDFIMGYALPILPIAIFQMLFCYIFSIFLGLKISLNIFLAILVSIPCAVIFIALGLLCGSLLSDKSVGGVCGALLTNITAWLSGTWFDLNLVGKGFKFVANLLPFSHGVNAARAAISGNYSGLFKNLLWTIGYAIVLMIISIIVFKRKMNSNRK
ncbi:MAG: ABC transporter permease [Sphaerochaetaceae bacterium]